MVGHRSQKPRRPWESNALGNKRNLEFKSSLCSIYFLIKLKPILSLHSQGWQDNSHQSFLGVHLLRVLGKSQSIRQSQAPGSLRKSAVIIIGLYWSLTPSPDATDPQGSEPSEGWSRFFCASCGVLEVLARSRLSGASRSCLSKLWARVQLQTGRGPDAPKNLRPLTSLLSWVGFLSSLLLLSGCHRLNGCAPSQIHMSKLNPQCDSIWR